MYSQNWQQYLSTLKTDFTKLAKLEFLQPNGSVAFALDNQVANKRSKAFIQEGDITVNLQNGSRRQVNISLANLDGAYDYALNKIWFGQQIRLSEGLILPDGTDFYIPQGVFLVENPEEAFEPGLRQASYQLTDKWAAIDGTLGGNLEVAYGINAGTNIFAAIASLLRLNRFDMSGTTGAPIDAVAPLFTSYYNDKKQKLTDGTSVSLITAPYDYLSSETGNISEVILGLVEMLAAWVGYNPTGRLTVDPSQDDILDASKPVLWDFSMGKQLMGIRYAPKPAEVYNDVIVVGATNNESLTARGRAQNRDISSDTCISRIGLKTKRLSMKDYYSDEMCQAYAEWQLKRYAVLGKTVTLTTTQMFHIVENQIITIRREDKPGAPVERHLVQGFTRPIGQTGTMTINAVSVNDFPIATAVLDDGIASDKYIVSGNTLYIPASVGASVSNGTLTIPGSVENGILTLTNP